MKTKSTLRAAILAGPITALLALALGHVNAVAADGTWTLNGNGNWGSPGNWSGGTSANIADGVGAIANFDTVVFSANRNITLDTARTIGFLQLGNSPGNRSFNLVGGNILTLDNGGSNAEMTFKNGGANASIQVAVQLKSNLLITNNDSGGNRGIPFLTGGVSSNNGNLTITNNSNLASRTKFDSVISNGTGTITYIQTVGWTEFNQANTFTGTTTNVAGTMILANINALQNSALDTAASGVGNNVANGNGLKIRGVTALTLGGLTDNKDFGSLFNTVVDGNNLGYGALTALTLNPGTGKSHSYSGIIANGAANMTLTKTGAGTQTLSGNNTYTGATAVNVGTLYINGNGHFDRSTGGPVGGASVEMTACFFDAIALKVIRPATNSVCHTKA